MPIEHKSLVQKGAQKDGSAVFRTPCQPGRNSGQPQEPEGRERLHPDGWGLRCVGQGLINLTQTDWRFSKVPAAFSTKRLASSI
jgi:hypothetical protein